MSHKTAIAYAREIAAELGNGWTLDENTLRAEREGDSFARHWAGLVSEHYPGAELSINTSHQTGKLTISANYPKDWQPYIDGRGRVWREEISVSMNKTPTQIVKDITRRLFDATGYLARVAECVERKQASEADQQKAVELAERLAAITHSRTEAQRGVDYGPGARHLVTDDNARKFTAWPNTSGSRATVNVSRGGTRVDMELSDLSPDFAERVLRLWWASRQELDKEEE